jgi:hypothetical protein
MLIQKRYYLYLFMSALLLSQAACTKHEVNVAPVEIKPIHITIDINVKVDKALDDFFGDLDEAVAE